MSAGLSCGSQTIKYILFFFNFIFTVCGLLLVIIGALALKQLDSISQIGNNTNAACVVVIAVGVIIFVIAFYGCCGAVRESNCMLCTYAVLLLTVIVLEVAVCVMAFMYSGQAQNEMEKGIQKLFEDARQGHDTVAIDAVNAIQQNLECCGITGPEFYNPQNLPKSCCKPGTSSGTCGFDNLYRTGCKDAIKRTIEEKGKLLGYVAIGVAIVELLGVWFALGLAGSIKKAERASRY